MPRGKKKDGGDGPTKVGFVRSMPADMPPKEVADKAAEQGLTMTPKNVSTMRAKDRAREKRATKTLPKKSSGGKGITKTAYVLGLPSDMHARDVVAKAASEGMTLTEKHVATIRSAARKAAKSGAPKAAPKAAKKRAKKAPAKVKAKAKATKPRGRAPKAAPVRLPKKASRLSPEDLFRVAVLVVGLPRATSYIEAENRKLESLLGG